MSELKLKVQTLVWVLVFVVVDIAAWLFFQTYIPKTKVQYAAPVLQQASFATNAMPEGRYLAKVGGVNEGAENKRFIVRTGDMTLIVKSFAPIMQKLNQLMLQYQGRMVSSNIIHATPGNDYYAQRSLASLVARMPAKDLDKVMAAISKMATQVVSVSTNSQDITRRMVDNQAKLTNLEHAIKVLSGLMNKSKKMSDTVAIYSKIASLNSQLEVLKATIAHDQSQVAMSRLTVNLRLPASLEVHPHSTQALSWHNTFKQAWTVLVNNSKGLVIFLVNFIVGFLPIFIVLLVALGLIFWIAKKLWRKRK